MKLSEMPEGFYGNVGRLNVFDDLRLALPSQVLACKNQQLVHHGYSCSRPRYGVGTKSDLLWIVTELNEC